MEGDRRGKATCPPGRGEDTAWLDGLPDELRLAMTDVVVAAREGLLAMSVAVGLHVSASCWTPS
jgi:hypothetical protein